jgi:hypothetical protein
MSKRHSMYSVWLLIAFMIALFDFFDTLLKCGTFCCVLDAMLGSETVSEIC